MTLISICGHVSFYDISRFELHGVRLNTKGGFVFNNEKWALDIVNLKVLLNIDEILKPEEYKLKKLLLFIAAFHREYGVKISGISPR